MWTPAPPVPSAPYSPAPRKLGFLQRLRIGWQLLKVARENIRRIAGWALVTATVGLILRGIAERFGFLGRIIAGALGAAWGIVTYLVVPVLIFEKIGPWAAVKRSGSLLRQTWGEAAGGYFS